MVEKRFIAIVGASSAIGQAYLEYLVKLSVDEFVIYAYSRSFTDVMIQMYQGNDQVHLKTIYYENEDALMIAANPGDYADFPGWSRVVVCLGSLGDGDRFSPEKSLQSLSYEKFQRSFWINTILPAMIAKYFIVHLRKNDASSFVFLTAKVGSITDNRLGGWYAYRSAKTALNMFIKTAGIELQRSHPDAFIIGFHPGTVDSPFSAAYLRTDSAKAHAFKPHQAAKYLHDVLATLSFHDTGRVYAWDGKEISP